LARGRANPLGSGGDPGAAAEPCAIVADSPRAPGRGSLRQLV